MIWHIIICFRNLIVIVLFLLLFNHFLLWFKGRMLAARISEKTVAIVGTLVVLCEVFVLFVLLYCGVVWCVMYVVMLLHCVVVCFGSPADSLCLDKMYHVLQKKIVTIFFFFINIYIFYSEGGLLFIFFAITSFVFGPEVI